MGDTPHSRAYLVPWHKEGGLGGSSPHYRAYLAPWHQEGGLEGSSPHYRTYLTPLSEEGGLGGSSPHFRAYLTPLCEEGGLGGSSPHSRASLGLLYNALFLLNTIHREGTGYAGACHQHVYLIIFVLSTDIRIDLSPHGKHVQRLSASLWDL